MEEVRKKVVGTINTIKEVVGRKKKKREKEKQRKRKNFLPLKEQWKIMILRR